MVMPLDRVNVDTDQMVPKQFLKSLTREGFGRILFYDWRYLPGEKPNPEFVLNFPRYKGASVLLARANFGCGSSREHAPWGGQRLRLPRRHRAELRGHFLQQLFQERHPARNTPRRAGRRDLQAHRKRRRLFPDRQSSESNHRRQARPDVQI
jgi:hypothetical protein